MKNLFCAFVLLCTTSAIQASAQSLYGEFVVSEVADTSGIEMGVGLQFMAHNVSFRPLVGVFMYDGELEGYFVDRHGICRESNGRFAKKEYCDPTETEAYAKIEAAITVQPGLEIGGGYRFDDKAGTSYGLVAYRNEGVGIYAAFGSEYKAIGLSFGASF